MDLKQIFDTYGEWSGEAGKEDRISKQNILLEKGVKNIKDLKTLEKLYRIRAEMFVTDFKHLDMLNKKDNDINYYLCEVLDTIETAIDGILNSLIGCTE